VSNSDTLNRVTGLLVIEVRHSNPNGDPDDEGEPRQIHTGQQKGHGIISGVSYKRKLRDLLEWKEGDVWDILSKELGIADEAHEFQILESRGRDRNKIWDMSGDEFRRCYWDARVFGNTFLESLKEKLKGLSADQRKRELAKHEHFIRTGAAHFPNGVSVAPVEIERMTNTNKAGVEEGKDRGMAPQADRVVQHGVYCMSFFINPTAAKRSGCKLKDIDLLKRLIPYAYTHTASRARSAVEIRHAWYVEHDSPLGSYSDFAILDALTPKKRENPDMPSSSWQEYDVPGKLEGNGITCTDLMAR